MRTLIAWAGDDPDREGLVNTPRRVAKAYEELFSGYRANAGETLTRVFHQVSGYDDLVLVRDISFVSHCEHHIAPFFGKAHIGYYPRDGVVGLSKLARIVEVFARRLQTQEALSAQIVDGDRGFARHARRRADDRGRAYLHCDARRAQGGRLDRHDAVHRRVPRRPQRADPLLQSAARRGPWPIADATSFPTRKRGPPSSRNSARTGLRPASQSTPRAATC